MWGEAQLNYNTATLQGSTAVFITDSFAFSRMLHQWSQNQNILFSVWLFLSPCLVWGIHTVTLFQFIPLDGWVVFQSTALPPVYPLTQWMLFKPKSPDAMGSVFLLPHWVCSLMPTLTVFTLSWFQCLPHEDYQECTWIHSLGML